LLGGQCRNVGAVEQNAAGIGPQHPGHEVDQRRLAGAVRTDQRITRAGRKRELNVGSNDQRAEAFVKSTGGKRDVAQGFSFARGASSERPPRMPFGSSMTTAIRMSPIQKYQYCGLSPEN